MTVPIVAFFNPKGGVGKTSLVYHLAWMYAELGWTVVAADLDPQANLTALFLDEDRIEELRGGSPEQGTIYDALEPLMQGRGDVRPAPGLALSRGLHLIPGSLELSSCEEFFSSGWMECFMGKERAFLVTTAFWRMIQRASTELDADVALVDLSPYLGAINRAALIASDYIVVPVTSDPLSLKSLRTIGTVLRQWQGDWSVCVAQNRNMELSLPTGTMNPVGYVILQHVLRLDRPVGAHARNMARIPSIYAEAVLGHDTAAPYPDVDPNCLGVVKRHNSLMLLAQEARKPIFQLKASDGAIGSHAKAVLEARHDFEVLARRIAAASWLRTGPGVRSDEAQ